MDLAKGGNRGGRLSMMVIAVVVIVLVLTIATMVWFIAWTTADIDQRSLLRQSRLVAHVLSSQLDAIPRQQESAAVWDEAVIATATGDLEWIDLNLGTWMFDYFGHDRTYVLDARNEPTYAMSEGQGVPTAAYDRDRSGIEPLAERLRRMLASAPAIYEAGGDSSDTPRVSDLVLLSGQPAIVSLLPIVSDTGDLMEPAGSERLLASVVMLDQSFAQQLVDEYMLEAGSFSVRSTDPADAVYPLVSDTGRIIGFFEWEPYRPGLQVMNQTAPAIGLGVAIALVVTLLLVDQLRRSTAALEAGRQQAEHQALHDGLTGLPNRTSFERHLGHLLADIAGSDRRLAVLMLDLDRFKQVNDTLGHPAGDELIRAVAERVSTLVAAEGTLMRLGGDEFAVIADPVRSSVEALALAARINEAVGKPFDLMGTEAFIGVSIGVVVAHRDESDRRELTRKADIALYEAKAQGGSRAVLYQARMNDIVQQRHAIEADLREALRTSDQLFAAFQPLFDARTGRVIGAEALARWQHPERGGIAPLTFIPVAEASGLIEPLGEMILRQACAIGARYPGMVMAVNISPAQLRAQRFLPRLLDILESTGMRTGDLELEITESILLDEIGGVSDTIRRCRMAGLRIALDDFGTGYSSLKYLRQYEVDRIKIDRSFVHQLADGRVAGAIVQAIVTLAHAMNIAVTAEGVETPEQMRLLHEMGCNTFQGYLLSAPVTAGRIVEMFDAPDLSRAAPLADVA